MPKRELLLYTPLAHSAGCRLEEAVAMVVSPQATEIVHTSQGLARRLRRPDNGLEVAVILAASRKKLRELQFLEQMLESLRLILILPDAAPQTIAQGHNLRPRYVTQMGSDFRDVSAVLRKMLALTEHPPVKRGERTNV
ncbi:MAG: hypothetical protein AB1424_06535 [Thermodesulfobacteriota bacterium]